MQKKTLYQTRKQSRKNDYAIRTMEKELRECMSCKYFWGNNHQCLLKVCYKEEKSNKEKKIPPKCIGCAYRQSENYCFPCMKDLLKKN